MLLLIFFLWDSKIQMSYWTRDTKPTKIERHKLTNLRLIPCAIVIIVFMYISWLVGCYTFDSVVIGSVEIKYLSWQTILIVLHNGRSIQFTVYRQRNLRYRVSIVQVRNSYFIEHNCWCTKGKHESTKTWAKMVCGYAMKLNIFIIMWQNIVTCHYCLNDREWTILS